MSPSGLIETIGWAMTAKTRMSQDQFDAEAFRNFERAAHDEIADGYRDFFTAVTRYAVDPLLDAAMNTSGARVLDVTTGPGVVAFRAAARGASSVVGVDLAPEMVRLASAAYPSVEFREADAEDLPLPDRSFDAVVSNFGIGHFPRPERALAEFVRVARRGGAVAVSWWDVPARHRVMGIFFDAMSAAAASQPADIPAGPPMFRFSKDIELSELLRSAGLVDVIVRAFSFAHCLASPDELWNGILRGTVRTSIGIRRQPKAVQIRIRASKVRLPVMPAQIWNAQSAGLLSYFADGAELIRRTAVYVDKILKGAKAGDLPVEQPTKFELIINLKTARTLGLMIPIPLLARADQVID